MPENKTVKENNLSETITKGSTQKETFRKRKPKENNFDKFVCAKESERKKVAEQVVKE